MNNLKMASGLHRLETYNSNRPCCGRTCFTFKAQSNTYWSAGVLHFQQISNGHNSLAKQFPELGKTLGRFLRKEVGEMDSHPKKPMFAQAFEHILDTIGIESPAALQPKWMKWQYCDTLYATTFLEINF